jgi:hypothetical protein
LPLQVRLVEHGHGQHVLRPDLVVGLRRQARRRGRGRGRRGAVAFTGARRVGCGRLGGATRMVPMAGLLPLTGAASAPQTS